MSNVTEMRVPQRGPCPKHRHFPFSLARLLHDEVCLLQHQLHSGFSRCLHRITMIRTTTLNVSSLILIFSASPQFTVSEHRPTLVLRFISPLPTLFSFLCASMSRLLVISCLSAHRYHQLVLNLAWPSQLSCRFRHRESFSRTYNEHFD